MERLPRVLPFWMMLLGIVGFFILGVLYFDVRGREVKNVNIPTDVGAENSQPLPESPETTDAPTITEEQVPLALPPRTPTSNIPAIAVYDCWRHEWRDDRVIVDHAYVDFSNQQDVPLITEKTIHLSCPTSFLDDDVGDVIVLPSGETFFWLQWAPESTDLADSTVYRVNRSSGELTPIAYLPNIDGPTSYRFDGWSTDEKTIYAQSMYFNWHAADKRMEKSDVLAHLYRIQVDSGIVAENLYTRTEFPLVFLSGKKHAVGFEWTWSRNKEGGIERGFPAFFHRINLETGSSIRVGELLAGQFFPNPIAVDDNRVVLSDDEGAFILNVFTRQTARIKNITGSLDRLAITIDGKSIVVTGPNQPFTVIPVSELPKP